MNAAALEPLELDDMTRVIAKLPAAVTNLLMRDSRVALGGGFIRSVISGEEPHDIDLFAIQAMTRSEIADLMVALNVEVQGRYFATGNADTITSDWLPIQFIHRWRFTSIDDLCRSFDFTVCQAAMRFASPFWVGVVHPRFYCDLAAHRLVYTNPVRDEDSGGSTLRMLKFTRRGFYISPEETASVLTRLIIGGKLGGSDTESRLKTLLREVDPLPGASAQVRAEPKRELARGY